MLLTIQIVSIIYLFPIFTSEDWCHLMRSLKKITLSKEKPLKQREGLIFSDLRTDTCGSVTRARDELYIKLLLLSVEVNNYFLLL